MKKLYVVHCVDTEGPMGESLLSTFERIKNIYQIDLPVSRDTLKKLQLCEIPLYGKEQAVAAMVAPNLLNYNDSWEKIDKMLDEAMSNEYRESIKDDFGQGWVYSWHCMDHINYDVNPRGKDIGYGNIYAYYAAKINELKARDEINWHFHPKSITRHPLHTATSYVNSISEINLALSRRIIDYQWFPVVYRPGFHAERIDANLFLEQWIPFDYANQFYEYEESQKDFQNGRFGDWRRSPSSWRGYNPSHDDYQTPGNCRRVIFRCLNLGSRLRHLRDVHIRQAFEEADTYGSSILAFSNHDYRDIRPDVDYVRDLLQKIKVDYSDVKIIYAGAQEAAIKHLNYEKLDAVPLELELKVEKNSLIVNCKSGSIFGVQPFLAIKDKVGNYYHDNFDEVNYSREWSYVLDSQTIRYDAIDTIGVGAAGRWGGYSVVTKKL